MKEILLEDFINGKIRKNEVIAYIYAKLENVDLNKDTHGYYYLEDNKRVYVSYSKMKERTKGGLLRVGENEWERI